MTQLANFGSLARIEDGNEGHIHVSELVDDRLTHPKQVVSEGDDLLLRIIRIDPQRRRMGLSLRRALDTPDPELESVFGAEAVQERDALIERIRVRLEAEGIELGDAFSREVTEASDGESTERAESADVPEIAPAMEPAAIAVVSEEEAAAPAPRPSAAPKARKESPRQAVELPDDLDGELSAMAMAFAMAGAPTDLVAEASSEGETDGSPDREGGTAE